MIKDVLLLVNNIRDRYYIKKNFKKYKDSNLISSFDYTRCINYLKAQEKLLPEYIFSKSSKRNSLYSGTYACLLQGMYIGYTENERRKWIEYFDNHQREDGLFVDKNYDDRNFFSENGGWGAEHLVPHILVAYDRLQAIPKYELKYLKKYEIYNTKDNWLEKLDYRNIWGSSNHIMNRVVAMQYARDRLRMDFSESIQTIEEILLEKINPEYGMWFDGKANDINSRNEMIRGMYHILPIFYYDNIKTPFASRAIDQIVLSQNKWGGFDKNIGSSACADIDGLDPLLRLWVQENGYQYTSDIKEVVDRAKEWIIFNQNQDGGFVFERNKKFKYGNQVSLTSEKDESNLFATWFRCLSLELIEDFFSQNSHSRLIKTVGYECPL